MSSQRDRQRERERSQKQVTTPSLQNNGNTSLFGEPHRKNNQTDDETSKRIKSTLGDYHSISVQKLLINKSKNCVKECSETKDKWPKSDGKRKNKLKLNLIKDYPLYDEDVIDGFAILSFKCLEDIELTINGQKKKKKKDKSEKTEKCGSDDTSVSSVCSTSSSAVLSSLKCCNKSKLSVTKLSKNNESKDQKKCNKNEKKSSVCSELAKCSKKVKQNKTNSNNNNNNNENNKVVDNKERQKTNNVIKEANCLKSRTLEASDVTDAVLPMESSTTSSPNKKWPINEQHIPHVNALNKLTINGQKKKKKKDKSEKCGSDDTSVSSVCSTSSSAVLSSLKCCNKSNGNKSSKLSANKVSKNNGSKDQKKCNKNERKSSVDSELAKCSKKLKQNKNNSNNNNNNNKVVDNKERQKTNNVVKEANCLKSRTLDASDVTDAVLPMESSTTSSSNKKWPINEQHIPHVNALNKRETGVEDDLKEASVADNYEDCVSEDNKSISLTTSTSSTSVSSTQHNSLKTSKTSSNSDCDKVLSAKGRNSASNDSSLSSLASSATLPSNSCDTESDRQSSDCQIGQSVKHVSESESTITCSSKPSKPSADVEIKSNSALKSPPVLSNHQSPEQITAVASPTRLEPSEASKPQSQLALAPAPAAPINHISQDNHNHNNTDSDDKKTVNSSERTFQSHFIESVLRNTSSEQCNTRTHEDLRSTTTTTTNHSVAQTLVSKFDDTSKEVHSNSNSVNKVNAKVPKTTTSSFNYSDNKSPNALSKASNSVKSGLNESIPSSQPSSPAVKKPSSPVSSNQSSASKQIRYSSPSSHTNSAVPQKSASNRSTISSLSSLSQLSQSIGQNSNPTKERDKERDRDRDREEISPRRITTPGVRVNSPFVSNPSPQTTFAPIFSTPKSQLWSTSSSSTASNGSAGGHLSSPSLAPGSCTSGIGLASSLHSNHLGMFASPIPPVSLPSVGGTVATSGPPSPFIGDSLFSHQNQDFLLRRELDTRFLASQDRTINIPPPPYMRPELHAHMHLPQSQPYPLTPAIGSSLMPASNSHLYEKYPKLDQRLDQTFYGRNALGLPGFPSLSPLLSANGSSTAPQTAGLTPSANTPFGTSGHSAAFQPKLNSLSTKTKPSVKSGRWCAMHVRIAWEIYHHQQKQHLDMSQKSGPTSATSGQPKSGSSSEMLRPLNHLFSVGSRTQDLPPFSSALLNAATSRATFDSPLPSHHNQFGPTPASPHLSNQTTNFPRFPTFGSFGSLNSSLNLTPVVPPPTSSANIFGPTAISGSRDLPIPGCLPGLSASGPELWPRNVIPRPTSALLPPMSTSLSSTSSSSSSSWGGLKAEAERNRDDIFKRKASDSVDKEAKRFERDKSRTEERLDKHRDQSHSNHKHLNSSSHSHSSSHLRNGDIYSELKSREGLKSHHNHQMRSPLHTSNHSHHNHNHHSHSQSQTSSKSANHDLSAFDANKSNSVGVKNEQKDDLLSMSVSVMDRERLSRLSSEASDQKLKSNAITAFASSSGAPNLLNSSSTLAAMSLNNPLEKARLMNLFGIQGTPPPVSPHFTAASATDPLRSYWNPLMAASSDPFKNLHEFQMRSEFLDRENIFQRYSLLNSSGGGASLMEKLAKESAEKEMLSHSLEKHNNSKLLPHLRSNDTPFTGLPLHSPHTSHTPHLPPTRVSTPSSSSIFPANPYLNSLHSLSASAGSYVKSGKPSSLLHTSSSTSSSEPSSPSLVPTNGNLPALVPNVFNHSIHSSNLTNSKLSIGSLIDSPLEAIKDITHKTNESNSSSMSSHLIPNGNTPIDNNLDIAIETIDNDLKQQILII